MPKYLLAIYGDESEYRKFSQEEIAQAMKQYQEVTDEMKRTGALIASEALEFTATAKTVRNQEGQAKVTDGPFVETKEQLGGFYLLECKDQAEAVEWAKKIPAGVDVEVRQVAEPQQP